MELFNVNSRQTFAFLDLIAWTARAHGVDLDGSARIMYKISKLRKLHRCDNYHHVLDHKNVHGTGKKSGDDGSSTGESRVHTLEDLNREKKIVTEREAELRMEREQRVLRDRQLADKQRDVNYLAQALETTRAENLALFQAAEEVIIGITILVGDIINFKTHAAAIFSWCQDKQFFNRCWTHVTAVLDAAMPGCIVRKQKFFVFTPCFQANATDSMYA